MKLTDDQIGEIVSGINGSDILSERLNIGFWVEGEGIIRTWLTYEDPKPGTWPDLFAWLATDEPLDNHPELANEIVMSINEWFPDYLHDEKTKDDISTASGLLKLSKRETDKAVKSRMTSISGMRRLQGTLPDEQPVVKTSALMLNAEQEQQLVSLKRHRPVMIVFGVLHPQTREFQTWAKPDRRKMKSMLRSGWLIFEAK